MLGCSPEGKDREVKEQASKKLKRQACSRNMHNVAHLISYQLNINEERHTDAHNGPGLAFISEILVEQNMKTQTCSDGESTSSSQHNEDIHIVEVQSNDSSTGSCRVCFENSSAIQTLISPCCCKGTCLLAVTTSTS